MSRFLDHLEVDTLFDNFVCPVEDHLPVIASIFGTYIQVDGMVGECR